MTHLKEKHVSEEMREQGAAQLGADDRCCGRKPMTYKREPHRFCPRCNRAYSLETGKQIPNWAWPRSDGGYIPRHPGSDYTTMPGPTRGVLSTLREQTP